MRVGIYSDLRNPAQWRRPWPSVYSRALDVVQNAESAGADSVWLSEHHFFDDGYLPQPLTFAAAVAARTRRVRIGTAVLLAPLRRAVQIAEETAIVDLLSNGRVELGLGAGYRVPEFQAFGADIRDRFRDTDDCAIKVRRLLQDGGVTPPPAQERVPIWLGYTSSAGAERAGRLGEGLLAMGTRLLEPYLRGLADGGHDPSTGRMAGTINAVLADDPEAAWVRIKPHLGHQSHSYQVYAVEGTGRPAPPAVDPETLRAKGGDVRFTPRFHVLTLDEAVEFVGQATSGLPVSDIFFWSSIGGMDDDLVDRHVELVSGPLRDALAARPSPTPGV
jgi:alkanesulfonate monooxygenase SsuD/methylene tetrahydromethanopterin reductase-like flavin-dependent oxidoreductase (luciferase family)